MTVSNEAVEAAKAAMETVTPPLGVDRSDWLKEHGRYALLAGAIAAAAPFIQAQALEDAADEVERLGHIYLKPLQECTPEEIRDCNEYINSQPNTWLRARAAALRGQG